MNWINRRPRRNFGVLMNMLHKCSFCGTTNIDKNTLECRDCKTVMPRNYGPHQKKDKHGNKL